MFYYKAYNNNAAIQKKKKKTDYISSTIMQKLNWLSGYMIKYGKEKKIK